MLSMLGMLFVASTVGIFFWILRNRGFRRYPWEIFVPLAIAVTFGTLSTAERPTPLNGALLVVELSALTAALAYMGLGARFTRGKVSVGAGERMPSFSLPDSSGHLFESESLVGETAALYLFYRGDW